MSPIALNLPSMDLQLWWNQVLLGLVLAAALLGLPEWLRRYHGIDPRRARLVLLIVTAAELIGGRLHFVLNQRELFASAPAAAFVPWLGGLHAGGAVIAALVAGPVALARLGLPVGRFLDGLVPFAGLGIAASRLGCFLHGCCFGVVTDLPWGVRYPIDSPAFNFHGQAGLVTSLARESLAVHPLPLYFAVVGVGLAILGFWLNRRRHLDGEVAATALLVFGVTSAGLEFLRADLPGRPYWGGVPQLAWVGMLLALVGAVGIAAARTRVFSRASSVESKVASSGVRPASPRSRVV